MICAPSVSGSVADPTKRGKREAAWRRIDERGEGSICSLWSCMAPPLLGTWELSCFLFMKGLLVHLENKRKKKKESLISFSSMFFFKF